jgi:hypothetical protein
MMRTKVSLAVIAFLLGSSVCELVHSQQTKWKPFSERWPLTNVGAMLNKDAEASDPNGIHFYAEDLAHFLLPDGTGERYINKFADRLAKAEEGARAGKRELIPDTQVAAALDETIKRLNLPPMPESLVAIRSLRSDAHIAKEYPALLTADRNGTNCSPGEAVYLLAVLLLKDAYSPSASRCTPPPSQRAYRPGDLLPPAPPPGDPFAPYTENMVPVTNAACTAVLTSSDINALTLTPASKRSPKAKGSPKVKSSPTLGRHGLTVLFNSAATTLGF